MVKRSEEEIGGGMKHTPEAKGRGPRDALPTRSRVSSRPTGKKKNQGEKPKRNLA